MEGIQPIKELIEAHFNALSKKQQKVANFVLNNPTFVGTHSAAEVGKKAETSETTVIRFCYALGLEGYAELQKRLPYLFLIKIQSAHLGIISQQKRSCLMISISLRRRCKKISLKLTELLNK